MADSYVVSTATLKCSFGTNEARLTVYPDRTVFMTGKPMGNISDHAPIYNISPFGRCRTTTYPATGAATAAAHGKLTPMPCIPGTMTPWANGKNDVLVKGQPALLKSSYCRCQWGGVITITNDGQGGMGCSNVVKQGRETFSTGGQGASKKSPRTNAVSSNQKASSVQEGETGSVSLAGTSQPKTNSVSLAGISPPKTNSVSLGGNTSRPMTSSVSLKDQVRLSELIKEQPTSLSEEQRKAKAENNQKIEQALGIKKGDPMTIEEADRQSANPHYAEGKEFTVNCATCSAAYALRLQGFDVKAKGNVSGSNSHNEWLSFQHSFDIWNNADGTPAKPVLTKDWMEAQGEEKMTPDLYKQYFEETCAEEGVYIVTIGWNVGGGHATILQRDSDGNLYYIEPQVYDENAGERLGIDLLYNNLSEDPVSTRGILRVDDKVFNTDYLDLFEI